MNNNDVLKNIRYIFDLGDDPMMEVFSFGGLIIDRTLLSNWLKKDDHSEFAIISDHGLASFLNGFIIKNRGKQDGKEIITEETLNNNQILRKLKIALNLKGEDMVEILKYTGFEVSIHEINAFFRKPGQKQYRKCLDQFLRNFLYGLKIKYRGPEY